MLFGSSKNYLTFTRNKRIRYYLETLKISCDFVFQVFHVLKISGNMDIRCHLEHRSKIKSRTLLRLVDVFAYFSGSDKNNISVWMTFVLVIYYESSSQNALYKLFVIPVVGLPFNLYFQDLIKFRYTDMLLPRTLKYIQTYISNPEGENLHCEMFSFFIMLYYNWVITRTMPQITGLFWYQSGYDNPQKLIMMASLLHGRDMYTTEVY